VILRASHRSRLAGDPLTRHQHSDDLIADLIGKVA
jgi:hypothetical protein